MRLLGLTFRSIEKDFFQILQPSSDEDNGGNDTNDFDESFDRSYTMNGTFDNHLVDSTRLGIDKDSGF